MRVRERSMLNELKSLQNKKDRIKRLKKQQDAVADRLRDEIKRHNHEQDQAKREEVGIQRALDTLEKSKKEALEAFKLDEMRRIRDERLELEREKNKLKEEARREVLEQFNK